MIFNPRVPVPLVGATYDLRGPHRSCKGSWLYLNSVFDSIFMGFINRVIITPYPLKRKLTINASNLLKWIFKAITSYILERIFTLNTLTCWKWTTHEWSLLSVKKESCIEHFLHIEKKPGDVISCMLKRVLVNLIMTLAQLYSSPSSYIHHASAYHASRPFKLYELICGMRHILAYVLKWTCYLGPLKSYKVICRMGCIS